MKKKFKITTILKDKTFSQNYVNPLNRNTSILCFRYTLFGYMIFRFRRCAVPAISPPPHPPYKSNSNCLRPAKRCMVELRKKPLSFFIKPLNFFKKLIVTDQQFYNLFDIQSELSEHSKILWARIRYHCEIWSKRNNVS